MGKFDIGCIIPLFHYSGIPALLIAAAWQEGKPEMNKKRVAMVLVTGGVGFVGSHLVEALLQRGHRVRVLDNLSTGKKENLEEVTGHPVPGLPPDGSFLVPLGRRVEFVFGGISDLATCLKACQGVSFVFHQAALGSVQRSVENPISTHSANATGALNVLQAAKEAKVKRLIYASSSSVYGNISSDPEEVVPKAEGLSATWNWFLAKEN